MSSVGNAPPSQASDTWRHAQKVRKLLLKQLEKVPSDGGIDLAHFEKIDSLLENMRLACVQTIFLDFEFAAEEKTENALWSLHTSVNSEYRRALGKLKGNAHVVERRKVDKMYQNFLRIAQKFYKGYVQRITARYDIQELQRIANGIEVQQPSAGDMISPVPEALNRLVLKSCHATLIRLGDLARYRVQARYKKFGGYNSALTYYALANDLLPESGFGHHQMGIIQLDEGNQLEVVYRFYRAWAAAEPHPNAKGNLEAKFKDLRAPNTPAPRQVSATPRDTFSMWFIKLHALFYKGEAFSQHSELEGEVIHRLDMMAKDLEVGEILLKAILINIAAFHIAGAKYAGSKKDCDLQFARFTMALNARFVTVLCDLMGAELEKHSRAGIPDPDSFPGKELPRVVLHLLPMLRVYMIWLASRRKEIFTAPEATGGLLPAMLQSLNRVLTLMCTEATEHKGLSSCPYLLAEDLEIRGLQPLEEDQVPNACRCFCNDAGGAKPRKDPQTDSGDAQTEALGRLLDILRIGYFFAEDQTVPLSYRIADDTLVFEYSPNKTPNVLPTDAMERTVSPSVQPEANLSTYPVRTGRGAGVDPGPSANLPALQPNDSTWSDFSNGDEVTNDQTENTVMSMLTPFLKPPTPQAANHVSSASETSYGLHSATAEEVFGLAAAQRSPGGTVMPTTFEQLPWGWLHTPTPQSGNSSNRDPFPAELGYTGDFRGPSSPHGMVPEFPKSPLADRASSAVSHGQPTGSLRSPFMNSTDDEHRNQLLQSFTGAGSAPRTSSFSHWSPEHNAMRSRQNPAASSLASAVNSSMPVSSNHSAFSHPSSLYQGTPGNSVPATFSGPGSRGGHGLLPAKSWQASTPNDRQRQVNTTTSTYNAAIFDAALKD